MSNEVVLDIETQNSFEEVGGFFTDKLKVSLVIRQPDVPPRECFRDRLVGLPIHAAQQEALLGGRLDRGSALAGRNLNRAHAGFSGAGCLRVTCRGA